MLATDLELFLQNKSVSQWLKDRTCLVAHNANQFKENFHYDTENSQFDLLISNKSMHDQNKQITKQP